MNPQPTRVKILFRRKVVAWALYDFGNSAFATSVIAGFFPIFYSALSGELSSRESQFWFNLTISIAGLVVAVCAPLLGAIADLRNARKKLLFTFAALGIIMSVALAWVHSGHWQLALFIYAFGVIGFSAANIFYDAMLLEIAAPEEFDVISAFGYALGYLGGGILLAINVISVLRPQWFGLADSGAAVALAFISVAVWWTLFTLPLLFTASKNHTKPAQKISQTIGGGFNRMKKTLTEIKQNRPIFLFLLAYFLYIDGVSTIFKVAVFFATRILQLPQQSLIIALLLTQFIAFPAAILFGYLGEKFSARRVILFTLMVYCAVILYAWRWLTSASDFYLLAASVGLVQGGVQSLSRSLYAKFIPPQHSADYFGAFNMVGKFAAIIGPLLIALTPFIIPFADARDSILSLLLLFIGGGILLWRVGKFN